MPDLISPLGGAGPPGVRFCAWRVLPRTRADGRSDTVQPRSARAAQAAGPGSAAVPPNPDS
ncbi:MAG: hypothetical protein ACXWK5_05870, partial [Myxococcaceae bacterium]